MRNGQANCCLKACNSKSSSLELHNFFVQSVWRMIGGDRVYCPVRKPSNDCFNIRGGSQWRIHLAICVVVIDRRIGKHKVMWSHFASHANFVPLCPSHCLQRVGRGEMRYVQARSIYFLCEMNVALNNGHLC